jgi:hypothetical protein
MSKKQDKKKSKPEQKQIPAVEEEQKIKSPELTDADLDKVSGGAFNAYLVFHTDTQKK